MPEGARHFPLRPEHRLLVVLAAVSIFLAVALPLAYAPQKATSVETRTVTRKESYLVTSTLYDTRTIRSASTYAYAMTSRYTNTYVVVYYITTTIYPQITGTGPRYGISGIVTVIPVQIQQTEVRPTVIEHTTTIEGQRTVTQTQQRILPQVGSTVETMVSTRTLPFSSVLVRSYGNSLAWLSIGIILPIVAYHRINAYRTLLHIYYEILRYAAYSSRLPSHVMRACNLETRKFESYIQTLTQKELMEEIRYDGNKLYRTSRKGLDLIQDEKVALFVKELP